MLCCIQLREVPRNWRAANTSEASSVTRNDVQMSNWFLLSLAEILTLLRRFDVQYALFLVCRWHSGMKWGSQHERIINIMTSNGKERSRSSVRSWIKRHRDSTNGVLQTDTHLRVKLLEWQANITRHRFRTRDMQLFSALTRRNECVKHRIFNYPVWKIAAQCSIIC